MRRLRLALLPLLVATSLAAQAPAPSGPQPATAPSPERTAFFDVAAIVDSRERFGMEPLIFGRWAIGLVGTHSRSSASAQVVPYGAPLASGPVPTTLCPIEGCPFPYPGAASSYSAWSLDFAVRYYPAALAFNDARHRLLLYVGEFVGYQWRTLRNTSYLYPPVALPTSGAIMPCPASGCGVIPFTDTRRLSGWEPGAEIGARLKPFDPVFVDVGGWFKIVTVDDPMQSLRPGQLDARLVVAVGVGW